MAWHFLILAVIMLGPFYFFLLKFLVLIILALIIWPLLFGPYYFGPYGGDKEIKWSRFVSFTILLNVVFYLLTRFILFSLA